MHGRMTCNNGEMIDVDATLCDQFKRLHYSFDVMLMCVRWYLGYGPSVSSLEEMRFVGG